MSQHSMRWLFVAVSLLAAFAAPAQASRFVKIVITLEGKPILIASTGDDGSADAYEVWNYLKTLTFAPTNEFPAHKLTMMGNRALLESHPPAGEEGRIEIDAAPWGQVRTRELELIRVPPDEHGPDSPSRIIRMGP